MTPWVSKKYVTCAGPCWGHTLAAHGWPVPRNRSATTGLFAYLHEGKCLYIKSFQETVHIIKKVTAERDLNGSFAEEKISADDLESEY